MSALARGIRQSAVAVVALGNRSTGDAAVEALLTGLAGSDTVTSLDISERSLTAAAAGPVAAALASLPRLTHLTARGNPGLCAGADGASSLLRAAARHPALSSLDLGHTGVSDGAPIAALSGAAGETPAGGLRELVLDGASLGASAATAVSALGAAFPALDTLSLSECSAEGADADAARSLGAALLAAAAAPRLSSLSLSGWPAGRAALAAAVTAAGADAPAPGAALRKVALGGDGAGPAAVRDAEALAAWLATGPAVGEVDLSHVEVGARVTHLLKTLSGVERVRLFNVMGGKANAVAHWAAIDAAELARTVSRTRTVRLDLGGNEVPAAAVTALVDAVMDEACAVRELELFGADVSEEVATRVDAERRANGNAVACDVVWRVRA